MGELVVLITQSGYNTAMRICRYSGSQNVKAGFDPGDGADIGQM